MSRVTVVSFVAICACAGGDEPRPSTPEAGDGAPRAIVTNYPLEYFAQRIGGGVVQVEFPMAGDGDPAFWQPNADAILRMQSADVILTNGATYEKWIDQVSLPMRRVINTSASFTDRYLEVVGTVTHTHGPGGDHSHEGTAFTTWLDPSLAGLQAETIAEAFSGRWPANASAFQDNLTALRADLEQLDQDLRSALTAMRGVPLLASHPVYQYLASRYALDLESVTWEPEEMPSERAWRAFRDLLARHPARWMIWEAEPMPEIRARLRELDVRPLMFAPLGNRPTDGDYIAGMNANVRRLGAVVVQ